MWLRPSVRPKVDYSSQADPTLFALGQLGLLGLSYQEHTPCLFLATGL